jgi:hypothetical protein
MAREIVTSENKKEYDAKKLNKKKLKKISNSIRTEDGYVFHKQPSGLWTDTKNGKDYDMSCNHPDELNVDYSYL